VASPPEKFASNTMVYGNFHHPLPIRYLYNMDRYRLVIHMDNYYGVEVEVEVEAQMLAQIHPHPHLLMYCYLYS